MNVKKKLISSLKKCFILSLCVVIGLVASLQGFCASTINIDLTKYSCSKFTVLGGANSYTCSSAPSITSNRFYQGVWVSNNTFTTVLYTLSTANSVLSAKSNYSYDVCFDLVFTDSTSISDLNSVIVYLGDNDPFSLSYTTSGSTRIYSFSSNHLGQNMSSILSSINLGIYFNAGVTYTNFAVQNFRVVEHTPNEDVVNAIGSDTPNTSQVDEYNKAESQLIGGVQSSLDGITSQWDNINGDLSQYGGAFFAIRQFFNGLTDLPFVSVVITLSVAIGVFALLLGSALSFVNRNRK